MSARLASLSPPTYRRVDIATKLVGLVLVAAALDVGIESTVGLSLAVLGAALAVCTVFITEDNV